MTGVLVTILIILGAIVALLALLILAIALLTREPKYNLPGDYESHLNMDVKLTHSDVQINGIKLHIVSAGPENGEPVILLHGFPDFWIGWEAQLRDLAAAGFHVIVPDQRGNGSSDMPAGVMEYTQDKLVADVIAIADHFGFSRFNLAGHDFGAVVSWSLARRFPQRLKKLVIVNVPHPIAMLKYMSKHPSQILRSWYAFVFQVRGFSEWLSRFNNFSLFKYPMSRNISAELLNRYVKVWSEKGRLEAMINWYRAQMQERPSKKYPAIVEVPLIIIWGKLDVHIDYRMAEMSLKYAPQSELHLVDGAGHFILQDKPDLVSYEMIKFLEK